MSYDPFERGSFPVGVRTFTVTRGERPLPVEIWAPAPDEYRGRDVASDGRDEYETVPGLLRGWQEAVRDAPAREGRFPLVFFSHGFGGHRRQSTFFCTHLASHGYVVAAVDHTGNTIADMVQAVMQVQMGGAPPPTEGVLDEFIDARPADVSFVIDALLDGSLDGYASRIDRERIGMSGHSFGGWTTLAVTERDRRIRSALPLAPAGGSSPLPTAPLARALTFEWGRDVPTFYLVAERDTLLPLPGMHELFERTRSPKRLAVLRNSDHMHFCDQAAQTHELFRMMPPVGEFEKIAKLVPPFAELCTEASGYDFVRGLGLAHFDATLRTDESAAAWLASDVEAALAARGVVAEVVGGSSA